MPRFVILRHEVPQSFSRPSHWDFMLEVEDVLLTWSLDRTPEPAQTLPAKSLADHRKAYLDYEGAVSSDRGSVRRWDWGEFDWLQRNDQRLKVRLRGNRLQGTVTLQRMAVSQTWQLTFVSDEKTALDDEAISDSHSTDRTGQNG
jgi:hypothetical protein